MDIVKISLNTIFWNSVWIDNLRSKGFDNCDIAYYNWVWSFCGGRMKIKILVRWTCWRLFSKSKNK